jgi:hypothetical protein
MTLADDESGPEFELMNMRCKGQCKSTFEIVGAWDLHRNRFNPSLISLQSEDCPWCGATATEYMGGREISRETAARVLGHEPDLTNL